MFGTLINYGLATAAATLLVLSGSISFPTESAPQTPRPDDIPLGQGVGLALMLDERADRIVVTAAEGGRDWSRLGLRLESGPAGTVLNAGDAEGEPGVLVNEGAVEADERNDVPSEGALGLAASETRLSAGDFIALCASGASRDVAVSLVDSEGAWVQGFTFRDVHDCDEPAPRPIRGAPRGEAPPTGRVTLVTVDCFDIPTDALWINPGADLGPTPVFVDGSGCGSIVYLYSYSSGSIRGLGPGHHDCFHPLPLPPIPPEFGERALTVPSPTEVPAPFTTPPRTPIRGARSSMVVLETISEG